MLVLSRRAGQVIELSNGVRIVVTRITGGKASIAIDAPKSVEIRRGEIGKG